MGKVVAVGGEEWILRGSVWTPLTTRSLLAGRYSYFSGLAFTMLPLGMLCVCMGVNVYACAACVTLTIHSRAHQAVPEADHFGSRTLVPATC